jgi:hypothetical protein
LLLLPLPLLLPLLLLLPLPLLLLPRLATTIVAIAAPPGTAMPARAAATIAAPRNQPRPRILHP